MPYHSKPKTTKKKTTKKKKKATTGKKKSYQVALFSCNGFYPVRLIDDIAWLDINWSDDPCDDCSHWIVYLKRQLYTECQLLIICIVAGLESTSTIQIDNSNICSLHQFTKFTKVSSVTVS